MAAHRNSTEVGTSAIVALLKDCAKKKDLEQGHKLHKHIVERNLIRHDIRIANTLISLYVKCKALVEAEIVFKQLQIKNVVSWNALITGYAENGEGEKAWNCFKSMKQEAVVPDEITFICILKACASIQEIRKGNEVHTEITCGSLLDENILVSTALIDIYAKCGAVSKAHEIFDRIPVRTVVSWNALMAGYARNEHGREVLECFQLMQNEGLSPDAVSFVCILTACGATRTAWMGKKIHAEITRGGLLEKNLLIGNALVDMYSKCGLLAHTQEVFEALPVRNIVAWTALISGYAENGHEDMALNFFEQMQDEGLCPNAVTFLCVLKACGNLALADKGKEIHSEIIRQGLLETDHLLGKALVDMYAKCGTLLKAQEVFDQLHARDVILWTALIVGYMQHGYCQEALHCFDKMKNEFLSPNEVTFICILKACSNIRATDKGREIHSEIVRRGLLHGDSCLGTALMDMYAKCCIMMQAWEVFCQLQIQDLVSWNIIIAGYVEVGYNKEALSCFQQMQIECLLPNAASFVCVLKACANIGAQEKGKEIHSEIALELLEADISVGNALLDMYAKCGAPLRAQQVFDQLPLPDLVSWTAVMAAYAQAGNDDAVVSLFDRMIQEGTEPDLVTFTVVLNACSHSGLLEKGQVYFEVMCTRYCIAPTIEHYTCMIDLFSRAGHFCKALAMVQNLPTNFHLQVWTTLLGACKKWGKVELAKMVFEQILKLDEQHVVAYVCMSNIYADNGMQEDADRIDSVRMEMGSIQVSY